MGGSGCGCLGSEPGDARITQPVGAAIPSGSRRIRGRNGIGRSAESSRCSGGSPVEQYEPSYAIEWASGFNDEDSRQQAYQGILQRWAGEDMESAGAWLLQQRR